MEKKLSTIEEVSNILANRYKLIEANRDEILSKIDYEINEFTPHGKRI